MRWGCKEDNCVLALPGTGLSKTGVYTCTDHKKAPSDIKTKPLSIFPFDTGEDQTLPPMYRWSPAKLA
jgi:hypothetical protein